MRLLDRVNLPSDLKKLTLPEAVQLAKEIREELIATVSANGGHLASNLGVVELTIGLHRVFNSPRDKIIWDVGHQSYTHKLLTGRKQEFPSIRQYEGLSGFTARDESPHDPFGAGHASTSISAALGIATARDLARENFHVVAVIGDGALTGGMAFEALNHAGHLGTKLIVVLNDNGMAISPNVGAVARMLNKVRFDPRYEQVKKDAKRVMRHLPRGESLWRLSKRFKNSVTGFLLPAALWQQLGFDYLGPIDGHRIEDIELALSRVRNSYQRPTLVHIITQKGKGYLPAENDAVSFHGVAGNGGQTSTAPSYSEVLGQTLLSLLKENQKVVVITAAMLEGTGLSQVKEAFPERVFDVGICEQHAVTFAGGLATQGFIPVVAVYSTFLQRAYDQIIHDICVQNLHVVFAIDRAGIVGDDGKTHQGAFDLSYLSNIPNIVVAAPKDEAELRNLLYTATRAGCPMAVRYPRGSGWGVSLKQEWQELALGKGELLRQGKDVTILAIGATVYPSLEAARLLAEQGIDCSVINARFAKPLDRELFLGDACQTGRVLTVEENALAGGFGSAVLRLLAAPDTAKVSVRCLGLPDEFIQHGAQSLLRAKYRLDSQGIVNSVYSAFPELTRNLTCAHRSTGS